MYAYVYIYIYIYVHTCIHTHAILGSVVAEPRLDTAGEYVIVTISSYNQLLL